MNEFLKIIAGVLITIVFVLVLNKQGKDFSVLLVLLVCCAVIALAVNYLQPVLDFINKLQILGKLDLQMLRIVLKAVGIGLLAEITNLICKDTGNAALGKTVEILASAVILWLMIPLLTQLIELIETMLGAV